MPDASVAPSIPNLIPQALPFDKILRSAFNPRKHFDPEKVAELADSIAANGLEQNLLVRPHPTKPDHFELIGGERRHRAIEKLIAEGRVDKARPWPVQIAHYDDKQALIAAIAENMARADLTEMEQAEAFHKLKTEMGMEASAIAPQVGLNVRTVQKRMKLVTGLIPEAQKALRDGEITVEAANAIAMADRAAQKEVLNHAKIGFDTEELKDMATNELVPVGRQCFDVRDYKGEFVEADLGPDDPADAPTRWFKDTAQVKRLIDAKVKAEKTALAGKYPWVEAKQQNNTVAPWNWTMGKAKDAGALILVNKHTGELKIHAPISKPKPQSNGGPVGEKSKAKVYSDDFIRHTIDLFEGAMNQALIAKPAMAVKLAVFELLDGSYRHHATFGKAVDEILGKAAKAKGIALWKAIDTLPPARLAEILAFDRMENDSLSYEVFRRDNHGKDKPATVRADWGPAIDALQIDMAKSWEFYGKAADEFLEACGLAQLQRIALDLAIDAPPNADAKALRGAIAKNVAANRKYLPPWLHLETADKLAQRLKPPAKAPAAKAKPAPAAKPKGK